MPSPTNRVVIAAAGSRKTQGIIEAALATPSRHRSLITTFTRENTSQIMRRLSEAAGGCPPPNVSISTWFGFLMNQAARPYQSAITGQIDYAQSLNFKGQHPRGVPRGKPFQYYFDPNADFYRDGVAEFAVHANRASGGKVIRRLEALYDYIYIDELQDFAGYDYDFLDLLFASTIKVTAVGDPRQGTYRTNRSNKNSGADLLTWLKRRTNTCVIEPRTESWRCNQEICNWADAIYPDLSATTSRNVERTGHDGVFLVAHDDVLRYFDRYRPMVLRWNRKADTHGLPAMNIGMSKGSTFDRVLIFPTKPWMQFLRSADLDKLSAPNHLYVGVTRARHSVAFVVSRREANYTFSVERESMI